MERLGALARVGRDEEGVTERKRQNSQGSFAANTSDLNRCFPKVKLGFAGWLTKWHVGIGGGGAARGDHRADLALRAVVAMFVTQAFKDALGGVALLWWGSLVVFQDLINRAEE